MYNQIYDFIINLGLEHNEIGEDNRLRVLDLIELDLQVQENETSETVNYHDNLYLCAEVCNVSYDTITDLTLNRLGVL